MISNADQGVLIAWTTYGGTYLATASASGSFVFQPQLPNGESIKPVLQAQDGSFVGVLWDSSTNNLDMVAFDAGGATRWIVPNEQPQIATADGGVIGQSGITYDQNGNATGMMNLLTYSWLGYAYQSDPAQVRALPLYAASGFWWLLSANNSGNNAGYSGQDWPPLTSCTDKNGTCQGPLGPRDLLGNAKTDLTRQLSIDQACMNAANTFVFSKILYGGIWGFSTHSIVGQKFVAYLQGTPQWFYNGPKSTLDFKIAKCGIPEPLLSNCSGTFPPQTVAQQFTPDETALTVSPSTPLKSFWQPAYTPPTTSSGGVVENEGFGVGIDPSINGANIFNESILIHEALHGMTGLSDFDIQGDLMGQAGQGLPSVNISIYIKDNVLSKCPSFRGGQQ
jgi:hypothetical protein